MFKLIDFIIYGCWHQWKIIHNVTVRESEREKALPVGYAYICQCTKCGQPKRFNMY